MTTPEQEIATLERFESQGVMVVNIFTRDQIKMWAAIKAAREALAENHQWHIDYDDYNGYEESVLHAITQAALTKIDTLGK